MNAFHPALTGVLYSALAEYEQRFVQLQLVANSTGDAVDGEVAVRYAAVVDGLKRMIKTAEPSGYGNTIIEAGEEMRRRHALLGDIFAQLADFKIGSCHLSPHSRHGITVNVTFTHHMPELDPRESMCEIARRLELQYGERRHSTSGTTLHIQAEGKIQGVDVEIYELIEAERPFCDTHHVMVDDAGVCPQCPGADTESPLLAELRVVHASRPFGAYAQACAFCSDGQGVPVPWPCPDLRYAEVELGGPEARAEIRRRHFGRKDPEEGRVCAGCSEDRGVPIMWPCLLLRAVDRIEDVLSADAGLVSIAPPDSTESDDCDLDGEPGECRGCQGWHRPPWCADLSQAGDVDDSGPVGGSW